MSQITAFTMYANGSSDLCSSPQHTARFSTCVRAHIRCETCVYQYITSYQYCNGSITQSSVLLQSTLAHHPGTYLPLGQAMDIHKLAGFLTATLCSLLWMRQCL